MLALPLESASNDGVPGLAIAGPAATPSETTEFVTSPGYRLPHSETLPLEVAATLRGARKRTIARCDVHDLFPIIFEQLWQPIRSAMSRHGSVGELLSQLREDPSFYDWIANRVIKGLFEGSADYGVACSRVLGAMCRALFCQRIGMVFESTAELDRYLAQKPFSECWPSASRPEWDAMYLRYDEGRTAILCHSPTGNVVYVDGAYVFTTVDERSTSTCVVCTARHASDGPFSFTLLWPVEFTIDQTAREHMTTFSFWNQADITDLGPMNWVLPALRHTLKLIAYLSDDRALSRTRFDRMERDYGVDTPTRCRGRERRATVESYDRIVLLHPALAARS